MKKIIVFLACTAMLFACGNKAKTAEGDAEKMSSSAGSQAIRDYEIGDNKYRDMGKKVMDAMASGDLDTWSKGYSDNAIFRWSGGDSLVGRAAIGEYWKKRRTEVIDSLVYSNEVWLPMKVNTPQSAIQLTGNYALLWTMVHVKYKNGKSMDQRMHMVFHFDADDKIDRTTQYIDRAPINAVLAK